MGQGSIEPTSKHDPPLVLLYPSFGVPLESFMLLVNLNKPERQTSVNRFQPEEEDNRRLANQKDALWNS